MMQTGTGQRVTPTTATPPGHRRKLMAHWLRSVRRRFSSNGQAIDAWKPAGGVVLVIAPHPDDEVLGCGGTLVRHRGAGDLPAVVYLTRGEKSRGFPWLSEPQRQAVRELEARASSKILGADDLYFLDGADRGLDEPGVYARLVDQLAEILAKLQPKVIYAPHPDDHHPDHNAAYRMLMEALKRSTSPSSCIVYQYEVWSPLHADYAVDITRQMPIKRRAIRCHRSALAAFDYVQTMTGLSLYRCQTMLQHRGFAEAFKTVDQEGR